MSYEAPVRDKTPEERQQEVLGFDRDLVATWESKLCSEMTDEQLIQMVYRRAEINKNIR